MQCSLHSSPCDLLDSDNCDATECQAWACPKKKYPNVYS